jgi:hypothetical protein
MAKGLLLVEFCLLSTNGRAANGDIHYSRARILATFIEKLISKIDGCPEIADVMIVT